MTTLRTAAQQALEAMEQLAVLAEYGTTGPDKCDSSPLNKKQATALRLAISDISRAQISKLRAALAEPDDDALTAAYMLGRHDGKRKPLTEEEILKAIGWDRAEMYMKLTPNFPVAEAKKETLKNARAIERAHGIGDSNE